MDDQERFKAINPYSIFRRIWEYVMFFFSALVLFELPFEWIFDISLTYKWIIPSLIMDVIFAIDIGISQNTGIFEFGVVSLNKRYIHAKIPVIRKIIYWITPIPFYLIGYFVKSQKVYRILLVFKLLRIVRLGTSIYTMRTSLIYVGPFSKMLILLIFLLFIDHIFTCIFWLVGNKELPGPSWLHEVASIDDESQIVQYIHTFYYITTTILTIGYGDLHPYTFNEIVVIIIVECIGVFFYNFFLSNMVSIVADPSRTSFLEKYQKVYIAFKWRGVSNDSILELLRYFEYVWERDHDETDFYENAKRMPDSLKKKVALALHAQLFQRVESFKDLNGECLGQIAIRLRPRIFTPGDYIIKAGSLSKKIFFLSSGKVQVLSSCGSLINSHEGPSGIIFGIGSFLSGSEEVTCVIAQTYVETYELTKSDFDDLKEINESFRNVMRGRKVGMIPPGSRPNGINSIIAMPRVGNARNRYGVANNNDHLRRATAAAAIDTNLAPSTQPNRNDDLNLGNAEKPDSPLCNVTPFTKLPTNASSIETLASPNPGWSAVSKDNPQLSLNQAGEKAPTIQVLSNSTINVRNNKNPIRISDVVDLNTPPKKSDAQNLPPVPQKVPPFEAPSPSSHLAPLPMPRPMSKEMPVKFPSPSKRQSLNISHKNINVPPIDPDISSDAPSSRVSPPVSPKNSPPILPKISPSRSLSKIPPLSPRFPSMPKAAKEAPLVQVPLRIPTSPHELPKPNVQPLIPESIDPSLLAASHNPAQNVPPLIPSEPIVAEPEKKHDTKTQKKQKQISPQPQPALFGHFNPDPSQFSVTGNQIKPKTKKITIADMLNSRRNQNEGTELNKPPVIQNHPQNTSDDDDDDDETDDYDDESSSENHHPPV